jgi:hypothetical protein
MEATVYHLPGILLLKLTDSNLIPIIILFDLSAHTLILFNSDLAQWIHMLVRLPNLIHVLLEWVNCVLYHREVLRIRVQLFEI